MGKKILGIAVLVAMLAALGFITFHTRPEPVQSFRKADGTLVTLLGVTYGTNHTMVSGKPYQRSLYKILPIKLKSWSGARIFGVTSSQTNVPMFWVLESGSALGPPITPVPRPGSSFAARLAAVGQAGNGFPVRLLDEFGSEYDPQGYTMGRNGAQNEMVSHYQFNAGDPHGEIVGIRVYDSGDKTNHPGTFLIPGKAPRSIQATNTISAPVQDGEMTFQLTSLLTGMKSAPFTYSKSNKTVLYSQAAFQLTKNGKPVSGWFPSNLEITDAKGKMMVFQAHSRCFKGDDVAFNFEGALEPANGPFKLRVEFDHLSNFSSNELVTLANVPFPANGESLASEVAADGQGFHLSVEKIYGAFSEKPNSFFQAGQPLIQGHLTPAGNSVHLQLIHATDETGNELQRNGSSLKPDGEFFFSLGPNTKASSLTLTFAVRVSRFAEFEAMPVAVSTNEVASKN